MDSVSKTFKNIGKSIFGKKTRKNKHIRSSQSSASKSRSKSRQTSSNSSTTRKFKKQFKKFHRKFNKKSVDVDKLVKDVDTLHADVQNMFAKKKKKTPDSPLVLSVKNLDTGKVANATVIKDLNTGKYEFYKLSGSK